MNEDAPRKHVLLNENLNTSQIAPSEYWSERPRRAAFWVRSVACSEGRSRLGI